MNGPMESGGAGGSTPMPDRIPAAGGRRRLGPALGRLRGIPIEAVFVGLGLFVLLTLFVAADPAPHVTYSFSPYTDEGFNLVNARNLIQLGRWSADDWTRYMVELPFSLLEAAVFRLFGVGIVQARLPMILCVSITASSLVWGLRGLVGRSWAVFGGLAFAGSGLVLYYGRLVYFEDLVVLGITLGTLVLLRESLLTLRGGILSGLFYAMAIGTKPNAAFAVAGIVVVLSLIWGWHDRGLRRWLAGVGLAIAVSGLLWAAVIWLPSRSAVAIDIATWPPLQLSLTPREFVASVKDYVLGGSDHVIGSLLGSLLALGGAGAVATVVFRGRLSRTEARLAAAAFGWAAFGFAILLVVSYRPNRYVVPLVPALAILAAIGFHVAGQWLTEYLESRRARQDEAGRAGSASLAGRARRAGLLERQAIPLLATAAILVAVAPGLRLYVNWSRTATYDLVSIQDRFAAAVPPGERVAGRDVALFLMKSQAVTTIVGLANNGDLYAQGTRWYLEAPDAAAPTGVSDATWASRQQIMCAGYGGATECLFHVP
jgi:4-amino-4-deoxy-L-arabinose transferase-like glycosyltransferase